MKSLTHFGALVVATVLCGALAPNNAIIVAGGVGTCAEHLFVTLDATMSGVVITDANGTPIFAGQ